MMYSGFCETPKSDMETCVCVHLCVQNPDMEICVSVQGEGMHMGSVCVRVHTCAPTYGQGRDLTLGWHDCYVPVT